MALVCLTMETDLEVQITLVRIMQILKRFDYTITRLEGEGDLLYIHYDYALDKNLPSDQACELKSRVDLALKQVFGRDIC